MASLSISHLNMNRSPNAGHFLNDFSSDKQINFVISINEPPRKYNKIYSLSHQLYFTSDTESKAVIAIKGPSIKALFLRHLSSSNFAVAQILLPNSKFYFISAYLHPTNVIAEDTSTLAYILDQLPSSAPIIICSDTNCRSTVWNDTDNNTRSETFLELISSSNLHITNCFSEPSFSVIRDGKSYSSLVDLILVNSHPWLAGSFSTVNPSNSFSDHKQIIFNFSTSFISDISFNTSARYNTKHADWDLFELSLKKYSYILDEAKFDSISDSRSANKSVKKLEHFFAKVCGESFSKLVPFTGKNNHSDTLELKNLKNQVSGLKSRVTRLRDIGNFPLADQTWNAYLDKLNSLNRVRSKVSKENWRNYISEDNLLKQFKIHKQLKSASFGTIIALPDSNGSYATDICTNLLNSFHSYFPNSSENAIPVSDYPHTHIPIPPDLPTCDLSLDHSKLSTYVFSFKPNKAPGKDCLSPLIIQKAFEFIAPHLLLLYNNLIQIKYFPKRWKASTTVLIQKPGSNLDNPSSKCFRPIALLPFLGKILEKHIVSELGFFLYSNNLMDNRQFGFVKQTSTLDALLNFKNFVINSFIDNKCCISIFLDITGAFDSATWSIFLKRLIDKRCPSNLIQFFSSLYTERTNSFSYADADITRHTTQGCPQGSVSGPILFNLILDDFFDALKFLDPRFSLIQAYADDSALNFRFDCMNPEAIKTTFDLINYTLNCVHEWGLDNNLTFNPSKTKAIIFSKSNKFPHQFPHIIMNNSIINLENEVKYLGVHFDNKFTFKTHIDKIVSKAKVSMLILNRQLANTFGPSPSNTKLLFNSIIYPKILYAAPIFFEALSTDDNLGKLRSFNHLCNLKINKAYRTSSLVSNCLLSGNYPLELMLLFRAQIEITKRTSLFPDDLMYESGIFTKDIVRHIKSQYDYLRENNCFRTACSTNVKSFDQLNNLSINAPAKLQPKTSWLTLHRIPNNCFTLLGSFDDVDHSQLVLYTDGSKNRRGTGAGFTLCYNNVTLNDQPIPMHSSCTNYQAEQLSIIAGLEYTASRDDLANYYTLTICSDSLSTISALHSGNSDNYLINCIKVAISNLSDHVSVYLVKVNAHTGISGNEKADSLAKEGSTMLSSNISHFNLMSIAGYKSDLSKFLWTIWLDYARNDNKPLNRSALNSWTKSILPTARSTDDIQFYKNLHKHTSFFTTQFLVGHGCFGSYLHKFKIVDDPICPLCSDPLDTPYHTLFDCPNLCIFTNLLIDNKVTHPGIIHKMFLKPEPSILFSDICRQIITTKRKAFSDLNRPP